VPKVNAHLKCVPRVGIWCRLPRIGNVGGPNGKFNTFLCQFHVVHTYRKPSITFSNTRKGKRNHAEEKK
jgi:hypothetical protein